MSAQRISLVTQEEAKIVVGPSIADVEAKAKERFSPGATYAWQVVNATTGVLEDFGGGKV